MKTSLIFLISFFVVVSGSLRAQPSDESDKNTLTGLERHFEQKEYHKVLGLSVEESRDKNLIKRAKTRMAKNIPFGIKTGSVKGYESTNEYKIFQLINNSYTQLKKMIKTGDFRESHAPSEKPYYHFEKSDFSFRAEESFSLYLDLLEKHGDRIPELEYSLQEAFGNNKWNQFIAELVSNPFSMLWLAVRWDVLVKTPEVLEAIVVRDHMKFSRIAGYHLFLAIASEKLIGEKLNAANSKLNKTRAFILTRLAFTKVFNEAGYKKVSGLWSGVRDSLVQHGKDLSGTSLLLRKSFQLYLDLAKKNGSDKVFTYFFSPTELGVRSNPIMNKKEFVIGLFKAYLETYDNSLNKKEFFKEFKKLYYRNEFKEFRSSIKLELRGSEFAVKNEKIVRNWIRFKEPIGGLCFGAF